MTDLSEFQEPAPKTVIGIKSPAGVIQALGKSESHIVKGDLDYIANQMIIRNCFYYGWDRWEKKIKKTFDDAIHKGMPLVSLYARSSDLYEIELLRKLSNIANHYLDIGVLFHFFNVEAISQALDIYLGRPLINYVSGEKWALARVLPLLERHQVPVVVQPIGDRGIPLTSDARMEIILHVSETLKEVGINSQDIYVDPLSPAINMIPCSLNVSLETIAKAKIAGFRTIAWPANVGLGHPNGKSMAATFAAIAVNSGLDLAVVSSDDIEVLDSVSNSNLLLRKEMIWP